MIPIVLVPGLLCTSEVFAPQIHALWPYGPITVASTLRGDTIAEMATAILENAPPTFALAGISMGGYVCLEIAHQAPERLRRLALLSTSARPDTAEQSAQRRQLMTEAEAGGLEQIVERTAAALRHPSRRDDARLLAIGQRMAAAVGLKGFLRQTQAIIGRADSRSRLPSITAPTLVLTGDVDPLMPPDIAQEMAEAIPNSDLTIVSDCGHSSTLEQPEAVNDALARWLVEM